MADVSVDNRASKIRTYRDLGRHSASISVVILNVIQIIFMALTFIFPIFQRVPYSNYTINYFFTTAEIDENDNFGGDAFGFEKCDNKRADKDCTKLYNTGMIYI